MCVSTYQQRSEAITHSAPENPEGQERRERAPGRRPKVQGEVLTGCAKEGLGEGEGSLLNLSSFPHRAGALARGEWKERAFGAEGQGTRVGRASCSHLQQRSSEGQCDPVAHPYAKGTHEVP